VKSNSRTAWEVHKVQAHAAGKISYLKLCVAMETSISSPGVPLPHFITGGLCKCAQLEERSKSLKRRWRQEKWLALGEGGGGGGQVAPQSAGAGQRSG
jgi:hypothetical protein